MCASFLHTALVKFQIYWLSYQPYQLRFPIRTLVCQIWNRSQFYVYLHTSVHLQLNIFFFCILFIIILWPGPKIGTQQCNNHDASARKCVNKNNDDLQPSSCSALTLLHFLYSQLLLPSILHPLLEPKLQKP